MRTKIKTFFQVLFVRPYMQPFFMVLQRIALRGMNIGTGQSVDTSGETQVVAMVKREVKHPIIFDVGAHVGEYATMVQSVCGDECEVYAFEPSQVTFTELSKVFDGSKVVRPQHIALGSSEGTATLCAESSASSAAFIVEDPTTRGTLPVSETIAVTTLDIFCRSNDIDTIDLLKLDVEGYEIHVLHGASEMLSKRKVARIQFEFGEASIQSKVFLKDFFDILGSEYDIYRILQRGIVRVEYSTLLEVFQVANYLAVLKTR